MTGDRLVLAVAIAVVAVAEVGIVAVSRPRGLRELAWALLPAAGLGGLLWWAWAATA